MKYRSSILTVIAAGFSLGVAPSAHAGLFEQLSQAFQQAAQEVKHLAEKTKHNVDSAVRHARKSLRKSMRDAGQALIEATKKLSAPAAKQALHGPFFAYIAANRASFRWQAKKLRADEKKYLAAFFPQRLIDRVRVLEREDTGFFNKSAGATTFGPDFIIIRKGHRSDSLLRHEFVHVCQYDRLGVQGFAHHYADQYVDGGYSYRNIAFEKQAYGFKSGTIQAYLGYCE